MIFQPGIYYVGDLGFVLPNDDLRHLFAWNRDNVLTTGYKAIEEVCKGPGEKIGDTYWIAKMQDEAGTIYDKNGKGWGFDWGCFGVLPWDWVTGSGTYDDNKIEFTEPFTCSMDDDGITVGHLQFTFNSK